MEQSRVVKIEELQLWDKNPRSISEKDFERLKRQIKKLGQYKPLLVNQDNIVLGGNMRLRALQDLGVNDVWVNQVKTKDEAEMIEYALSDNDRAGEYDEEQLAELATLHPIDLELFHVDLGKATPLPDLVDKYGPEAEEDEPPEVDESNVVSKLGEVYQLGKHRVMCGSCTRSADINKLMDKKATMLLTDPPYNVDLGHIGNKYNSFDDNQSTEDYKDMLETAMQNAFATTTDDSAWYIFSANRDLLLIKNIIEGLDLRFHQWLMWVKRGGIWGNSDYIQNYEIVTYGYKGKHQYFGSKGQEAAMIIDREQNINSIGHPTSKPIKVLTPMIKGGSNKGDIVLDLFLGSGSTLIACEQTGRICYGMEIDPKYVDVVRKRYAKFIDKEEEWEQVTPLADPQN